MTESTDSEDTDEESQSDAPAVNAYEQERAERIARNRQIMEGMGIAEGWRDLAEARIQKMQTSKKQKATPSKVQPWASRKSSRISSKVIRKSARLDPELKRNFDKDYERDLVKKAAEEYRKLEAAPPRPPKIEDAEKLYRHNLMRAKKMSTAAMERRIQKITNVAKMESLIIVLRDLKQTGLAQEAEFALKELQAMSGGI